MDHPHVPDAIAAYLTRIGRIPLLSAEEELVLGRRVQAATGSDDPDLVADARLAHGALVRANLRLVVAQARLAPSGSTSFLDLVQEGNVGLMRAADGFDPDRGFRFSTYAHDWIAEAVWAAVAADRVVRLPPRAGARLARCRRAREELGALGAHDPGAADVARATGYPVEEVQRLLRASRTAAPLDAAAALVGAEDPAEPAERTDRAERVLAALDRLESEERRVLVLRYGLSGEPCSLTETARRAGIDVGRVRRLEETALRRLRAVDGLAGLR